MPLVDADKTDVEINYFHSLGISLYDNRCSDHHIHALQRSNGCRSTWVDRSRYERKSSSEAAVSR